MSKMCMGGPILYEEPKVEDPKSLERVLAAIGELVPKRVRDLVDWETEHFLWKYKEEGGRFYTYGICSGCKKEIRLTKDQSWQHNKHTVCPECQRVVTIKDSGRKHTKLVQEFFVTEWKKSKTEPGTIVAVTSNCWFDSRSPLPEQSEMKIAPVGIYAYRYGKEAICFKNYYYGGWYRVKEVTPANSYYYGMGKAGKLLTTTWFDEAIAGTRFETVWTQKGFRVHGDGVNVMANIAKKPYIEYFLKLGLKDLAREAMLGSLPRGAINPRGKTAQAILKMSGQQLSEIKQKKIKVDSDMLRLHRLLMQQGIRFKMEDVSNYSAIIPLQWHADYLKSACEKLPVDVRRKGIQYIVKMIKNRPALITPGETLKDIDDYWGQLLQTQTDMHDERTVFPKNFWETHAEMSTRIKIHESEEANASIEAVCEKLKPIFEFEHGGLIMRPFATAAEVIVEGQVMRHCVGGYVKSYASGKTILCALRRAERPGEPFRTLEFSVKDHRLVQCRGHKNQSVAAEQPQIDAFFEAWKKYCKDKQKKGRKAA